MSTRVLLAFVLSLQVSLTPAPPSGTRQLSLVPENAPNTTDPNPLPPHEVHCLHTPNYYTLVVPDCAYVINCILLREDHVFRRYRYVNKTYRTDSGGNALARWPYRSCEVTVRGSKRGHQLWMSFVDVALAANKIVSECVADKHDPIGGVSAIGDEQLGFTITVRGTGDYERVPAKNDSVSHQPAVDVSKRSIQPPEEPLITEASREIETRNSQRDASLISTQTLMPSNITLNLTAPPSYPVHCFNPLIIHLPPAVASDCSYVINRIILRLSDPTALLIFGFTDAADINLSKPQYQKWQHGQCVVSVMNNDVNQLDTFRLVDVAETARRVTMQCVVVAPQRMGGVANIGGEGSGFYVYVGGPSDDGLALGGGIF